MTDSPVTAKTRRPPPLTRPDDLRQLLDRLEAKIGLIRRGLGGEAIEVLTWLDQTQDLLVDLTAKGGDFTAEMVRHRTILAQFEHKAALFLKEIGGAEALAEARKAANPAADHWWWTIDAIVAKARADRLRRLVRVTALGGSLLVIAFVAYRLFFAPDPATLARLAHQSAANDLALQGDYAGALDEIAQALAYAPDDSELLITQGALHTILEDEEAAQAAFDAARVVEPGEVDFLLIRAQVYAGLQQPEQVLLDAQAAVDLDPESARGYYFMAVASDALGDTSAALTYLELTGELARQAGNIELEALSRIYMSDVLQRSFSPSGGGF